MERRLGLIAAAGPLPAQLAAEARRRGWRVVAFAFDKAPGLAEASDDLVRCRLTDVQAVLSELLERRIATVVFAGKLWKSTLLAHASHTDAAGRALGGAGFSDGALVERVVATLDSLGIGVLDPRPMLSRWMPEEATVTGGEPAPTDWADIAAGLRLGLDLARHGVGQTVVRARGATLAVEAAEGTDETIRRGLALAGTGAIVVKAVPADHDFRFDVPVVGPATLELMRAGGARVLALSRGRVLLADRDEAVRIAEAADIAVVTVDDGVAAGV